MDRAGADVQQGQRGGRAQRGQSPEPEAGAERDEAEGAPRRGARHPPEAVAEAVGVHQRVVGQPGQPVQAGVGPAQQAPQVVVLAEEGVEAPAHRGPGAVGQRDDRPPGNEAAQHGFAFVQHHAHPALGEHGRRRQSSAMPPPTTPTDGAPPPIRSRPGGGASIRARRSRPGGRGARPARGTVRYGYGGMGGAPRVRGRGGGTARAVPPRCAAWAGTGTRTPTARSSYSPGPAVEEAQQAPGRHPGEQAQEEVGAVDPAGVQGRTDASAGVAPARAPAAVRRHRLHGRRRRRPGARGGGVRTRCPGRWHAAAAGAGAGLRLGRVATALERSRRSASPTVVTAAGRVPGGAGRRADAPTCRSSRSRWAAARAAQVAAACTPHPAVVLHAGTTRTWPHLAHHTLSFGAAWERTFDELTRTGTLI
ncbi:hypothetical protein SFUMM280S_08834 [Streptomyces fumanus]